MRNWNLKSLIRIEKSDSTTAVLRNRNRNLTDTVQNCVFDILYFNNFSIHI
jgi:hypothetical protein